MRFHERVAIITGGGRGIGRATAQLMAAEGGTLALVDHKYSGLRTEC